MKCSPSLDTPWRIGIDTEWLAQFVGGGSTTPDLSNYAEWASGATKSGVLVGTNSSGALNNVVALPASNPSADKVLSVKKNGTAVTWEDADRPAENPSSKTTLVAGNSSSEQAQGNTHTVGDGKGFELPVVTRVVWTGTSLISFYSTLTFDKYGRLYKITGESIKPVDTPTKVTWS